MVQWVFVNGMGLNSLVGVLLSCTALMTANGLKHPSECLQFDKMTGLDLYIDLLQLGLLDQRQQLCVRFG